MLISVCVRAGVRVQGQATPIYTAAMFGKAEVVAALVAAGANMNYPGKVRHDCSMEITCKRHAVGMEPSPWDREAARRCLQPPTATTCRRWRCCCTPGLTPTRQPTR